MTSKKKFNKTTALNFISPESVEKVDGHKEPEKIPEGYKRNPEYIELRNKRVQILLQPSIHKALKKKAKAAGTSVNEIINTALKEYLEKAEK